MIDSIKLVIRKGMHVIALGLNSISGGKLTPNDVTLIGLAAHLPIAWLIAEGQNYWAAPLLLIFGLFDTLDGELARIQKRESPVGGLLDSVTDRMKEVMLYCGAGYAIIARTDHPYFAVWAIAAVGCSLLTSYVNAAGDVAMHKIAAQDHAVNKGFRGGLFPFEIRVVVLLLGLVTNNVPIAIVIIALGAAYTAINRLFRVINKLARVNG